MNTFPSISDYNNKNYTSFPQKEKCQSYSSKVNKERNTALLNKILSTASPEVKDEFYKRNK